MDQIFLHPSFAQPGIPAVPFQFGTLQQRAPTPAVPQSAQPARIFDLSKDGQPIELSADEAMVWKKTKETSKPLSFETEWSDVTLAPHGVMEISLHHKSSPETEQAKRRYQIAPNTNNPPQHAHMWAILRMPSEYTGTLPPRAGTLTLFTQNHGLGCRIEIEAFPRWERHGNRSADARFWKFRIRMVSSDNGGPAYLLAETHYVDVKTERNPGTLNRNPKIKEESITRASSMSAPYTLSPPLGRSSKPSPGSSSRPLSTDMRLGSKTTILQSPDSMQSPESMSEATLRDFAKQIRSGASDGSSTFVPLLNVDPNAASLGIPTLTNVPLADPQLLQMAAPSFPQMMDPSWGLAGLPATTAALSVNEAQRTDDVAVDMVNRQVWQTFAAVVQNGVVGRIKPARGPCDGGTLVTIEGSGFSDDPIVHFGPVIIPTHLILQRTESSLSVVAPPALVPGSVSVLVYNAGGAQVCHGKVDFVYYDFQGNVDPLMQRIQQLENELERTKLELVEERKERMQWVGMVLRYNERGYLPVHEAVEAMDFAGLRAILEAGVDIAEGNEDFGDIAKSFETQPEGLIDALTKDGRTALMIAVSMGSVEAVEILIEGGAKIDLEVNGETALDLARMLAHTEIVDLLSRSISKSSSPKSASSRRRVGLQLWTNPEELKRLALQEQDVDAMLELAHLYETGTAPNIVKNPKQAFAWSLAAVQTGDVEAQLLFARYLEHGFGYKRSPTLALAMYQSLAKAGSEVAQAKWRLLKESMDLAGEDLSESSGDEASEMSVEKSPTTVAAPNCSVGFDALGDDVMDSVSVRGQNRAHPEASSDVVMEPSATEVRIATVETEPKPSVPRTSPVRRRTTKKRNGANASGAQRADDIQAIVALFEDDSGQGSDDEEIEEAPGDATTTEPTLPSQVPAQKAVAAVSSEVPTVSISFVAVQDSSIANVEPKSSTPVSARPADPPSSKTLTPLRSSNRSLNQFSFAATYQFLPNKPDEIQVDIGDSVVVEEVWTDGWGSGKNITNGTQGVFPLMVTGSFNENTKRANYAHRPSFSDELAVNEGDALWVVGTFSDGWAFGYNVTTNAKGFFPLYILSTIPDGVKRAGSTSKGSPMPIDMGDMIWIETKVDEKFFYGHNLSTGARGLFPSEVFDYSDPPPNYSLHSLPRTQSRKSDAEKNPQHIFIEQKGFQKTAPVKRRQASLLISWKELVLLEHVGFGPVAEVWSARRGTEPVTVKQLACSKISKDLVETFMAEAHRVHVLKSPHLQRLFGVTKDAERITLVTQSCPYGSLSEYLVDEYNDISWDRRWRFALAIAKGMAYLHRAGIVHGQLTTRNILVDAMENPVVADYGFAETRSAVLRTLGPIAIEEDNNTSIAWLAPEVLGGSPKSRESDIYAFAIVLWEIAMREPAYEGFTPEEIREGIITSRLPVESEWPSAFSDLIERCWHHNANDRPDFDEIVRHIEKSYHTSDADAPPSYSFSAAFPPLTRTRGSSKKGMSFTKPLSRRSARTSDSKMKLRLSVAARPPVHTVSV